MNAPVARAGGNEAIGTPLPLYEERGDAAAHEQDSKHCDPIEPLAGEYGRAERDQHRRRAAGYRVGFTGRLAGAGHGKNVIAAAPASATARHIVVIVRSRSPASALSMVFQAACRPASKSTATDAEPVTKAPGIRTPRAAPLLTTSQL
jgi:hypothetical protein